MKVFFASFVRIYHGFKRSEHAFNVTVAAFVGVLGGLGGVAFKYLIKLFEQILWGTDHFNVFVIAEADLPLRFVIPVLGLVISGLLAYYLSAEIRGHGVPEVIEAVTVRSGFIRGRVIFLKSIASAITISSGGSVGREGPIVQIGSSIGSSIGQLLRVSSSQLKVFVACGAAAGISSTFNAPIAGCLFAAEIIIGSFVVSQFSPIVISSVAGVVVSRYFFGNQPAFLIPEYTLVSAYEFIPYVMLGVFAGVVGVVFNIFLHFVQDVFDSFRVHQVFKGVFGGLAVAGIGLVYPHIHGVGYDIIGKILHGDMSLALLVVLIFAKIFATALTIGAGGSGGIFTPSLFIGASLGGLVGIVAGELFPGEVAPAGAYALVGMGALVSATTHAPLTAMIIIFELTNSYQIIPALMVSCVIGVLVSTVLKRESIYTMKLVRRGLHILGGRDVNVLRAIEVKRIFNKDELCVDRNEPLSEVIEQLVESRFKEVFVVDREKRLLGQISLEDVKHYLKEEHRFRESLIAEDVMNREIKMLLPEETLDVAMKYFDEHDYDAIPVVEDMMTRKYIGYVTLRDVVAAYNNEIVKHDFVGTIQSSLRVVEKEKKARVGKGYELREIDVPFYCIGRSIKELDIRKKYGVEVLLIKNPGEEEKSKGILPYPEYMFQPGDKLLLLGELESIKKFETGTFSGIR